MILDVIIPVFNKEKNILNCYNKINEELSNIKHKFIFIDDNSNDKTFEILTSIQSKDEDNVKVIRLSKTFGKDTCVYVGLENSKHNLVCTYDMDSCTVSSISKMYEYIINHNVDSVCMQINNEMNVKNKFINLLLTEKFDNNKTHNRIMKRNIVNSIIEYGKFNTFTRYTYDLIGFDTYYIKYDNKYSYYINTCELLNHSNKIANIVKYISYILLTISFIYLLFVLFKLVSVSNELLIFFMLILVSIQILLNYLINKYNKQNNKMIYFIKDKIGFDEDYL